MHGQGKTAQQAVDDLEQQFLLREIYHSEKCLPFPEPNVYPLGIVRIHDLFHNIYIDAEADLLAHKFGPRSVHERFLFLRLEDAIEAVRWLYSRGWNRVDYGAYWLHPGTDDLNPYDVGDYIKGCEATENRMRIDYSRWREGHQPEDDILAFELCFYFMDGSPTPIY